jgi:gliding motility-associated lipoprotein GldH
MRFFIIPFVFLCFTSCQSFFFDEKKELKDGVWAYQNQLAFDFKVDDTTAVYNIFLELKHSSEYPHQNLYAKVHVRFPDGQERKQQVSLELADGKGEWQGKCSGKTCTRRIPFMPNATFDQAGAYQMKFEQFTRQVSVEGINSLRLIVEKTKTKKGENLTNSTKK